MANGTDILGIFLQYLDSIGPMITHQKIAQLRFSFKVYLKILQHDTKLIFFPNYLTLIGIISHAENFLTENCLRSCQIIVLKLLSTTLFFFSVLFENLRKNCSVRPLYVYYSISVSEVSSTFIGFQIELCTPEISKGPLGHQSPMDNQSRQRQQS